jgi:hypothetical protein
MKMPRIAYGGLPHSNFLDADVVNLSNPLDNFPLIRSRDIEAVCDAIGRIYTRPAVVPVRVVDKVDATVNNCRLQHVSLAYGAYGAELGLKYPETELFVQQFPLRGAAEIICGRTADALVPGAGAVVSPGSAYAINYGADYAHVVLRLDARVMTEKLAAMTGAAINEPLRVSPQQDIRHPAAHMLQRYLPLLIKTLGEANPPFPSWWIAQTEQLLMTLFLCGHRHNYSHLLEEAPADAAPRQVRQAEEYIEANAQRAISLEELAQVTGVSAFSLFRSFKQSRGYSPLEFARRWSRRGKT